MQRGVPLHVAQGVAWNFQDESGLNSGINEVNPRAGRGGFGFAQWTGPRRVNLENYAASRGRPASDPDTQFDFFMQENAGPEASAWARVMNTSTPQEAAAAFVDHWERPAKEHEQARIAKYMGMAAPGAPTGMSNPIPQPGFTPSNQPLPQEAPAFANAAPAAPPAPNPAGFLSGLGSLLVSSAQASEAPPVPSLTGYAHAPEVNTADPLGIESEGNAPLDWEGSYPDVPPQDPYTTDKRQGMKGSIADMLAAMDRVGNNLPGKQTLDKAGADPLGAAKLHIDDILGGGQAAAGTPQPQSYDPTWEAGKDFLYRHFTPAGRVQSAAEAAQAAPAPIQGPPLSAKLGPMQGPPLSAKTPAPAPMQGPPMPAYMSPDFQGPPMSAMTPPAPAPMQGPPMPAYMRPDFQGPPMSAMTADPVRTQATDPVLPDTAPVPTPKPNAKKPFDTIGFLTALGGMAGLLGTGGPEVKPVSLNGYIHNPGPFQGLPMPRGLL